MLFFFLEHDFTHISFRKYRVLSSIPRAGVNGSKYFLGAWITERGQSFFFNTPLSVLGWNVVATCVEDPADATAMVGADSGVLRQHGGANRQCPMSLERNPGQLLLPCSTFLCAPCDSGGTASLSLFPPSSRVLFLLSSI